MREWDLRSIVLTGVTRGLGRALCEPLVQRGHTILGCGRSADAISELRVRYGTPHDFSVVDVADDHAVAAWASRLLSERRAPDLIINNAGVINETAPLWEISDREIAHVLDVNVRGAAAVVRYFVPAMIARGSGIIVNMSSGWGRTTSPEVAPYCASKWAIEGLTRSLAQELPPGLAAVTLNPGIIDTDMLRTSWGESTSAAYPTPDAWSEKAATRILAIGIEDSGRALNV